MQASSETSSAKANTDRNRWKQPSCRADLPQIVDHPCRDPAPPASRPLHLGMERLSFNWGRTVHARGDQG